MAIIKKSTCNCSLDVLNTLFECPQCKIRVVSDSNNDIECKQCKCNMVKITQQEDKNCDKNG